MSNVALVIPTIRENCFRDFVERWGELGLFEHVRLIVMEDNPGRTFDAEEIIGKFQHYKVTHLCWEDIDQTLGEDSWIIPRRSDTVRSFAYYYAWRQKEHEYILTLDDDCYPCTDVDGVTYDGEAFVKEHIRQLESRSRWFNTLNSVKPRGIPFYNTGENKDVLVNHGLWTNVLDYDAPYQLANPIPEKFSYDNRIVPAGQYFPMCGMNVMWKRQSTVMMYHLLMGQWVGPRTSNTLSKLPFDRFGDIWCGIFMKRIVDLIGCQVSTGMPYIRHERASNPFTNLKKEANGIEVNEKMWEFIDQFFPSKHSHSRRNISFLYEEMGDYFKRYGCGHPEAFFVKNYPEHVDYFKSLGLAMEVWARLFQGDVE